MLLNDLEYFVALAETGTFTHAAQKKFVSQPSITNALQRLETELGETLIIRQRGIRSIQLTDAGELLVKHSKKILRETEIIKSDITNQRKIWLGVPPIIGASIFPQILSRLNPEQIDAFHMVETGSSNMHELLDNDKIDMGFVGTATPDIGYRYDSYYITQSEFVVILPKNHPLASKATITMNQLRDERFISLGKSYTQHQVLVDQLMKNNMFDELNKLYITNELMTKLSLIAAGNGVGISVKLELLGRKDVVAIPLAEPIYFYVYLIQKREHHLSIFENQIKEKIMQVIDEIDFEEN